MQVYDNEFYIPEIHSFHFLESFADFRKNKF